LPSVTGIITGFCSQGFLALNPGQLHSDQAVRLHLNLLKHELLVEPVLRLALACNTRADTVSGVLWLTYCPVLVFKVITGTVKPSGLALWVIAGFSSFRVEIQGFDPL
jgi:hypothetical protein